ncbi:hypothetical protein WJX81_004441 [Elliptochloris bilobata]|uniref:Uncharacterized protein n=1 Tax=Elliptochloris bilobata TaxID=381761 RepID=A0AAW1RL38_9CHLO
MGKLRTKGGGNGSHQHGTSKGGRDSAGADALRDDAPTLISAHRAPEGAPAADGARRPERAPEAPPGGDGGRKAARSMDLSDHAITKDDSSGTAAASSSKQEANAIAAGPASARKVTACAASGPAAGAPDGAEEAAGAPAGGGTLKATPAADGGAAGAGAANQQALLQDKVTPEKVQVKRTKRQAEKEAKRAAKAELAAAAAAEAEASAAAAAAASACAAEAARTAATQAKAAKAEERREAHREALRIMSQTQAPQDKQADEAQPTPLQALIAAQRTLKASLAEYDAAERAYSTVLGHRDRVSWQLAKARFDAALAATTRARVACDCAERKARAALAGSTKVLSPKLSSVEGAPVQLALSPDGPAARVAEANAAAIEAPVSANEVEDQGAEDPGGVHAAAAPVDGVEAGAVEDQGAEDPGGAVAAEAPCGLLTGSIAFAALLVSEYGPATVKPAAKNVFLAAVVVDLAGQELLRGVLAAPAAAFKAGRAAAGAAAGTVVSGTCGRAARAVGTVVPAPLLRVFGF